MRLNESGLVQVPFGWKLRVRSLHCPQASVLGNCKTGNTFSKVVWTRAAKPRSLVQTSSALSEHKTKGSRSHSPPSTMVPLSGQCHFRLWGKLNAAQDGRLMQNIEYITGMSAYQIGMVEKRRLNAYMVFFMDFAKKHPHLGQVRALLLRC